jgi:hypothetical protein
MRASKHAGKLLSRLFFGTSRTKIFKGRYDSTYFPVGGVLFGLAGV